MQVLLLVEGPLEKKSSGAFVFGISALTPGNTNTGFRFGKKD